MAEDRWDHCSHLTIEIKPVYHDGNAEDLAEDLTLLVMRHLRDHGLREVDGWSSSAETLAYPLKAVE